MEACLEIRGTVMVFPPASCLDRRPLYMVLMPSQGRMLFEMNVRRRSKLGRALREVSQARVNL
jgi:hypothetical protein